MNPLSEPDLDQDDSDQARFVFCFLVKDFLHPVWQAWLDDDDIGAVVHPKVHSRSVWYHQYLIDTIPTAWADPSLVRAELALYRAGRQRYPQAEWFVFLSGDAVPLFSRHRTLRSILRRDTSVLYNDEDNTGHMTWSTTQSPVPSIDHPIAGHQFKLLSRDHVDLLLDDHPIQQQMQQLLALKPDAWTDPRYRANAAYDEVVIPTVLQPYLTDQNWTDGYICDFTAVPQQRHPKLYQRNTERFREAIQLARNVGSPVWFFRKVTCHYQL